MIRELPFAAVLVFVALAALLVLILGIRVGMFFGRRRAEKEWESRLETERSDAIKRSRAVLGGQFSEQLSPYLPGFPADPTEVRFIGKPVDFISFAGAAQGAVDEVVFIEVKTGGSKLSSVERSLRDAIRAGKVRYVEYRPDSIIPSQSFPGMGRPVRNP
jgi:predicted Holliday junction resolvase-like endonuclease